MFTSLLYILAYVVTPIVLGILANLSTPFARLTFSRVIDRSRQSRVQTLERALDDARLFREDPTDFHTYLFGQIFVILCAFGFSLVSLSVAAVCYPLLGPYTLLSVSIAWAPAAFGFGRAYWTVVVVNSVRRFRTFEQHTLAEIARLQRTTEGHQELTP
jgi:hypothetical protein